MKKTVIAAGAALLCFFATSVSAQIDSVPRQSFPADTSVTTTTRTSNDRWNNWDKSKYAMKPMPEALTTEKIFPAIGAYQLTDKDGATAQVTVTLDPDNKGIVWVEGLPQGKFKAVLRKSPAVYKIPEQKLGEETNAKSLAEGVLIYDRDANLLNVCIGCQYNEEDPGTAFLPAEEQAATQMETKVKAKNGGTKTKTKVVKAKPIHYSGSKMIQENAAVQMAP